MTGGARGAWAVALAWSGAALWFASARVPYDDEWFSIELALETDWAQFWRALQADVHPPWVALVDRWIGERWAERLPLHLARVLLSASAVALTVPWLARRLQLPSWAVWIAALHPIVFMYGAAARWYALLLLAHALRAYAIWSDAPRSRRQLAFLVGAVLGPAAGYVDALLLSHDSLWWLARSSRGPDRAARVRDFVAVAVAAVLVVALLYGSPLGAAHPIGRGGHASVRGLLTWIGLGTLAEAGPKLPFLLLALIVPITLARGLHSALAERSTRALAWYVTSSALAWAVSTAFGVWHPRYSLWLWLVLTAFALALWRRRGLDRGLLIASGGYLGVVLTLMAMGRGFVKADLNDLPSSDCARLNAPGDVGLLVVPYQRLAELVQVRCAQVPPVLRVPSIRIAPDAARQLGPLREALREAPPQVWSLHVNARSSLSYTDARVREVIASRCRSLGRETFGEVPHRALKSQLVQASVHRFTLERWACPERHAPAAIGP